MHRRMANVKYQLRTAISQQPSECKVKIETIHQEHIGNVPEMTTDNVEYLRQSFSNLMKAYNQQKPNHLSHAIKERVEELVQKHAVNFVLPISIIKLLVSDERGWSFCMSIKESASGTAFNLQKEVIFDKPLPPIYLSGNERYKKGAKYVMRSCLNQNPTNIFCHEDQIEKENRVIPDVHLSPGPSQRIDHTPMEIEYKISTCDEFMKNTTKNELSYENKTFTVFELIGCEDSENDSETYTILVPTKQNAYKKNDDDGIKFLNYSPKIEFQAEYGAERMTKGELIREWCDLFFRPNSVTERVRFDCVSGKVIHRQSVSVMEVEAELEDQCGIETQQLLQKLWHALQTISTFPDGDYSFQSDINQNNYIKVYQRTDNVSESLGIGDIFKNVSFDANPFDKSEWQPIDDRIITELHEQFQILPCAFPHSDYLNENGVQPPKFVTPTKKMAQGKRPLKIRPKDDSRQITKKLERTQSKKKDRIATLRRNKRRRTRARKKAETDAVKAEANEFQTTRNLLVATMDQFNNSSEQTFNPPINQEENFSSSIAGRTRRQSRCVSSPDKQQSQSVRRSGRVTTNKSS